MLVSTLGNVFGKWPRAGWEDRRAFDSAFDASYATSNQVIVLVKNVENEAHIDRCVQQLRTRASEDGFEAVKVQNYVIGSGRVPSASQQPAATNGGATRPFKVTPTIQGWLCVRPGGPGTYPACVSLGSPRCFGCGEAFRVPAGSGTTPGGGASSAATGATPELAIGDCMLVKRTLAPVVIVGFIAPDQDGASPPSRAKYRGGVPTSTTKNPEQLPLPPISIGAVVELSPRFSANGAYALGGSPAAKVTGTVLAVSTDGNDQQQCCVEVNGKSR